MNAKILTFKKISFYLLLTPNQTQLDFPKIYIFFQHVAAILPSKFFSVTVNAGEDVVLTVQSNTRKVYWRKNNRDVPAWAKKVSVRITGATTADSGIYECFSNRNQTHAVMRVIVRSKYTLAEEHFTSVLIVELDIL